MGIEVKDHSAEVIAWLQAASLRSVSRIGAAAHQHAQEEISRPKLHANGDMRPNIITGNLLRSIRYAVAASDTVKAAYIGTDVEYAPYVELGTSRSWAYPYLRPAATEHTDEYRSIVQQEFSGKTL